MIVLRRTAAALVALAATAAVVPAAAPTASAVPRGPATCVPLSLDDLDADRARAYADEVGFVFVGRVLDRKEIPTGDRRAQRDQGPARRPEVRRFEHTVTIVSALQGDVDNVVTVLTDTSPDGYGPLRTRTEYLFFADEVDTGRAGALTEDRQFAVARCSGTTRLPEALGTSLEHELQQVLTRTEQPGIVVDFMEPAGGVGDPPSLSRAVAPGIALGLVGILGLLLLSWIGRRGH